MQENDSCFAVLKIIKRVKTSTEDMAEQQNQTNCSFCPTLIRIIGSSASNPICDECLKKKDSVPSGFPFIMVNEVADYLCPICLSMIENAMELDCTHLMCKACLEYYEKCEIEKHDR